MTVMSTILFIVKLLSMVTTGVLGYLAIVTNYKDRDGKLTKWGHRARIGIAMSATLSVVLLGLEQFKAIRDAGEATTRLEGISSRLKETLDGQQKTLTATKEVASDMKDSLSTQQQLLGGNEKISSGVKENLEKQLSLLDRTSLILKEQNKGIAEQQYLRGQQKTLLNNLTSADSYCYVFPYIVSEGFLTLVLAQQGDYPIYDVHIDVTDFAYSSYLGKGLSDEDFKKFFTRFDVPTVTKMGKPLGYIKFQGADTKRYHVRIGTRYRNFEEDIVFAPTNGHWSVAFRVREIFTTQENGILPPPRLLLTHEAPGVPRAKNGEVQWTDPE